jgi:hypothetical protein
MKLKLFVAMELISIEFLNTQEIVQTAVLLYVNMYYHFVLFINLI